jgi:hypothetical protein
VSALLGTDQISGADERSSILVQSSDDRLTEVRSKPVAIITAVDNQDEIYNIFTFNRRYNPNNPVHRCQPSRHWNVESVMNLEDALKVPRNRLKIHTETPITSYGEAILAHHGNQCASIVACDLQHTPHQHPQPE